MTDKLLSYSELCDVTGAKRHSKQRQVLERSGIRFITRLDGSLAVTWDALNTPTSSPSSYQVNDGFNLGALNG